MNIARKPSLTGTLTLTVAILGSSATFVQAEVDAKQVIRDDTLMVDDLWAHRVLFVHHEQPIVITSTDPILYDDEPKDWGVSVAMAKTRDMVTLTIPSGLEAKQRLGPYTLGLRKYTVMLTLVVVEDKAKSTRSLKVKHKPLVEALHAAAKEFAREEREKFQKRIASALADPEGGIRGHTLGGQASGSRGQQGQWRGHAPDRVAKCI